MTAAVVWLVVWFLITAAGPGLTVFAFTVAGGTASLKKDKARYAVIGWALGALAAVTLFIVGAINVVLQIVSIIGLL